MRKQYSVWLIVGLLVVVAIILVVKYLPTSDAPYSSESDPEVGQNEVSKLTNGDSNADIESDIDNAELQNPEEDFQQLEGEIDQL